MARQHSKNFPFLLQQNIAGPEQRLNRPILWRSLKQFTTNQWYATTTRNNQIKCKWN